jgi:dihydropteroate synthase
MGIINVTPDSFSGDGLLLHANDVERAVWQAQDMVANGAEILDVGGESSRPGSTPVSTDEETRRVVPVIAALKKKLPGIQIAVDTVKAEVAEKAVEEGATIINDISALAADPRMAEVAARTGATVVLMHNRASANAYSTDEKIGGCYQASDYQDVVEDVRRDLEARVKVALEAGIKRDKIILDPGIGFGKTTDQNLALFGNLDRLKALGFPLLVGVSRKSFIGQVLHVPIAERLEGTSACVAIAVMQGADIIRVHDVKFMARVVKMAAALRKACV